MWRPATSEIFGYKLSPELVETISDLLEATRQEGIEHGVAVCLDRKAGVVRPGTMKCKGDQCSVAVEDCGEPYLQVGIIHTHPSGNPEPSLGDAAIAAHRARNLQPYGLDKVLDCNITAPPGEERGLLTCITPDVKDPGKLLEEVKAAIREARAGRHGSLFRDWELRRKYSVAETPLYSPRLRETILADPASYFRKYGSRAADDAVALLSREEVARAVPRAVSAAWEKAEELLEKARQELARVGKEEAGYGPLSATVADLTIARETLESARAMIDDGYWPLCDSAVVRAALDATEAVARAAGIIGALPEGSIPPEKYADIRSDVEAAVGWIRQALSYQLMSCECRPKGREEHEEGKL